MDSFNRRYDSEDLGILEIFVHHARNIHNICIYDNQDVYAKFSLTYNPDQTHSTRIINGGGKNPEFNEKLVIKLNQLEAVLKCEIWMLSRARNYMEDQLLGFTLVPISQFLGKGKVTQDYTLSSTDLIHSPAGTVKLSLSLNSLSNSGSSSSSSTASSSSISAEVVLLDSKASEVALDPVEYSRIEFPDMNVVTENHQMVSEFFNGLVSKPCSFLHLGASPVQIDDCEMTNSSHDRNSGFLTSTTTSISDDRNSAPSPEFLNQSSNAAPDTPTSKKGGAIGDSKEEEKIKEGEINLVKLGQTFVSPLGNSNMEAEQSAMQQQIVDMYMRSMQQFTESLAKMKLPMDLDKIENKNGGELVQNSSNRVEMEKKKKDGSRVFYGSRAFF